MEKVYFEINEMRILKKRIALQVKECIKTLPKNKTVKKA